MKLFLNACGVADVFRLRVEDKNRSETTLTSFQRPYVLVGRNTDSDLVLDHWQVSRRHCYLQMIGGRLFCLDLGSRTGTHWDGQPARWKWLGPEKSVHVGPYRIWCERGEDEGAFDGYDDESSPVPAAPLPGARLRSLDDPGDEDWRLESLIALVGRSPACHVRVSDPDLSKFHASLVHTSAGVWAVDLLGAGGVSVNGTRVRCARLSHGDEFTAGRHRFLLEYDDPEAMAAIDDDEPYEAAGKELATIGSTGRPGLRNPAGDPGVYAPLIDLDQVPESVAIAHALLAPMMQQFSMMQQQMFENFHQTMLVMMRSMQSMHRDHMDLVQRELDEVRRLTRELHDLQAEAARIRVEETSRPAPARTPTAPAAPPPPSPSPGSDPVTTKTRQHGPAPTAPRPATHPGRGAGPSKKTVPPSSPRATVDAHGQIQQRIFNLQNERQTRWQKILSMVGAGDGRG